MHIHFWKHTYIPSRLPPQMPKSNCIVLIGTAFGALAVARVAARTRPAESLGFSLRAALPCTATSTKEWRGGSPRLALAVGEGP
mmetsp:Transcript_98151/g.174726  ORF Transcript_98151/g.174726 Transcript_98151/m.174726 type:complete len:84 (-) Transcript_98151:2372-2623(-)